MKVIAINGSARKDGNTSILINTVFEELNKEGIETEQIQLAGHTLNGCRACYKCFGQKNRHCSQETDILNELIDKILHAQGLILGSPTYFSDVTANMRAFIERCGFVARANDYMLKGKVVSGVVAVRRAGGIPAFNSLNLFLHYMQMIIPGASYWNVGLGRNIGEVRKDEEGIETMRVLGRNMAWLMKKLFA